MAEKPSPLDEYQQEPIKRNGELAKILIAEWKALNISTIRREPTPTNPPDPNGPKSPKKGQWIAVTVE